MNYGRYELSGVGKHTQRGCRRCATPRGARTGADPQARICCNGKPSARASLADRPPRLVGACIVGTSTRGRRVISPPALARTRRDASACLRRSVWSADRPFSFAPELGPLPPVPRGCRARAAGRLGHQKSARGSVTPAVATGARLGGERKITHRQSAVARRVLALCGRPRRVNKQSTDFTRDTRRRLAARPAAPRTAVWNYTQNAQPIAACCSAHRFRG
jgi:hypothetical protein